MRSESDRGQTRDACVPRLVAGWENKGQTMSPEEGFLLSRIDGNTPWNLLRQIGGLPPEQVDRCLERWVEAGILEIPGPPAGATPRRAARPAKAAPPVGDAKPLDASLERRVDPQLDLPIELQRRILSLETRLDQPYHQLLGVAWDADGKAIKRAYFKLSKEFHPDRYFRREIGDFKARLECVFKRIVEAYELLSDPATRAEVQRDLSPESLGSSAEAASDAARPQTDTPPEVSTRRRRREMLERVRRQFRIPPRVLAERKAKARTFYDASRVAAARKRWLEAAASVRLAIAFDPAEPEYKRGFAEIQREVHRARAAELRGQAEEAMERHAPHEALRLYEEILNYQPGDAAGHARAALVALDAGEDERALEFAEQACELDPDQPDHHVALARVLRRQKLRDRARTALETALELDPRHREAQEQLSALRRLGRRR